MAARHLGKNIVTLLAMPVVLATTLIGADALASIGPFTWVGGDTTKPEDYNTADNWLDGSMHVSNSVPIAGSTINFDSNAVYSCQIPPLMGSPATMNVTSTFPSTLDIELKGNFGVTTLNMQSGDIVIDDFQALTAGNIQWRKGTIETAAGGSSTLFIGGGTDSNIGGGTGAADTSSPVLKTNMYVKRGNLWIGNFSSASFQMGTGSSMEIQAASPNPAVVWLNQVSPSGSAGGITALGVTPQIPIDGGTSSPYAAAGTLKRELRTRSNGDNPSSTPLEIQANVVVGTASTNGQLYVGDSLGLYIHQVNANGISVANAGTVNLAGGSTLQLSGKYNQNNTSSSLYSTYGSYNSKTDVTLQSSTVNVENGSLSGMGYQSAGANYGKTTITGDLNFGTATMSSSPVIGLADTTSLSDNLKVNGTLTFNHNGSLDELITLNWYNDIAHGTWDAITYGSESTDANTYFSEYQPPYTPTITWPSPNLYISW